MNSIRLGSWLISLNTAAALAFLTGCATPEEHSYNQVFGENLTTSPKYYIRDENDDHFKVVVHQGKPADEKPDSASGGRIGDVKTAASDVAKAEAQRLGWQRWQLNYIQEKDQGWMHVVVAEVKREPDSSSTFPQPDTSQHHD
jgi:hypothetical protein